MTQKIFLTRKLNFDTSDYTKICNVIKKLDRAGIIRLASGYCLGASDIVHVALKQENINSRLVECSCTISSNDSIWAIGHEDIVNPNEIDTHVVVITETEPPFLIDASITDRISKVIVDVVPKLATIGDDRILADYFFVENDIKVTYLEKRNQRFPLLHQSSIINRIEMDKKIHNDIRLLKYLNYIGITLSSFAVVAVINQIFRWFI